MHPLSKAYLDGGEKLPSFYGEDRLVLLPRDPHWFFAYWEVSPSRKREAERKGGKPWEMLPLALRVHRYHRESLHREGYFEIEINPEADNWYIKAGVPDKKYQVELGYYSPAGGFTVLLTSNMVTAPRDRMSDVFDENWRLPDWQARKLYSRLALSSLSSPERLFARKEELKLGGR